MKRIIVFSAALIMLLLPSCKNKTPIDVPSGKSVAASLYNVDEADFQFNYTMPSTITGDYYLVLVADGFDDLTEVNEDNNFFFYSTADGKPFKFINGLIQGGASKKSALAGKQPALFQNTETQTVVNRNNVNAYSPQEIMKLVNHKKSTGELDQKVLKYKFKRSIEQQQKRKAK